MATEIRQIVFNEGEILRAAMEFSRKRGKPLPPGNVTKLTIRSEPDVALLFTIAPDKGTPPYDFEIASDELGAALVMFCINHSIPLPATGVTKRLTTIDGHIALVISSQPVGDATEA